MTNNGTTVLEGRGVAKHFGGLKAVDNIDIKFKERQITLLIGPNGSGKTTLLNCLTGVYKPTSGQVLYQGLDITGKEPHEIAQYLARTFQIPQPFPRLTVLENLALAIPNHPGENIFHALRTAKWHKTEKETIEKAFDVLCLLALDHLWDKPSAELSGGQLKLLELGRALMTGTNTILMDEPVGSINPVLAHTIFKHLVNIRDKLGMAIIIVEHRLDLAIQYADYCYCLAQGQICCEGPPTHVVNDPTVIEVYTGE